MACQAQIVTSGVTRFANYINTDNLYTVPNPGAREEYWQKKKEVFNKISNPSLSGSNVIQFHGISGAPTTAWAIGMDFTPEKYCPACECTGK